VTDRSLPDPATGGPADEATVHVDAAPATVWAVVSDLARLPEWSPECTGVRWYGSPRGAQVGARFLGFNKQGWKRWATRNRVEAAEPERAFGWLTLDNRTRWDYLIEPDGDGSRVTLRRTLPTHRPLVPALAVRLFLGGFDAHDDHMRDNIRQSLDRLKAVIEG
jgi:uncharacterized protein YndB with AHSA1/START domain